VRVGAVKWVLVRSLSNTILSDSKGYGRSGTIQTHSSQVAQRCRKRSQKHVRCMHDSCTSCRCRPRPPGVFLQALASTVYEKNANGRIAAI
jgi:hypothetical protein